MKYIIGNWKMNPKTKVEAETLVSEIRKISKKAISFGVQPIVCPPAVFISSLINKKENNLQFGAQNISDKKDGSETGENSATQFKNIGVNYVILGHSECRRRGESDDLISLKIKEAVRSGLNVVLCVGEEDRDLDGEYFLYVANQIRKSLAGFNESKLKNLFIAYEPVWAIGENATQSANGRDFEEMSMLIKRTLSEQFSKTKSFGVPLLYGGSVDKKNAQSFLDVGADGLLIGRACLKSKDFVSIIENAYTPK